MNEPYENITPVTAQPSAGPVMPRAPAIHGGLAIAAFVLGIAGMTVLPLFGSVLAVIFGHHSRGNARQEGRNASGLATAGLILGYLGLAVIAIVIIAIVVASSHSTPVAPAGIQPTTFTGICNSVNPPPACG